MRPDRRYGAGVGFSRLRRRARVPHARIFLFNERTAQAVFRQVFSFRARVRVRRIGRKNAQRHAVSRAAQKVCLHRRIFGAVRRRFRRPYGDVCDDSRFDEFRILGEHNARRVCVLFGGQPQRAGAQGRRGVFARGARVCRNWGDNARNARRNRRTV